ncbi:MAG: transposase [Verrucomicrobium sp.]
MYDWRRMSEEERRELLASRRQLELPQHGPAHRASYGQGQWLFTAACFEHQSCIGKGARRMEEFERELVKTASECCEEVIAWVILPNHYHFLAQAADVQAVVSALGLLHGRTAFQWNGEDDERGRKVWFRCAETFMKSDAHFWATLNYIHHNPVKHGYVKTWSDWPYSSAVKYLEGVGREHPEKVWRNYPIKEYGAGWDD